MSLNPKLKDWRGKRVWIIGAGHGIGAALVNELHSFGAELILSGRTLSALQAVADGKAGVSVLPMDAREPAVWQACYASLSQQNKILDAVIFSLGDYTPMRTWQLTPAEVDQVISTNLSAVLYGITTVIPDFIKNKQGSLILLASVAGWGGMPNSLVYGATKAAMQNLAQTLYLDLKPQGIGVYLVNPGFVKTRLTAKNQFTMPALISPETAAKEICLGLSQGKFEIHFPKKFTVILRIITLLPNTIYFWLMKKTTGL